MDNELAEAIEIQLLLATIKQLYGYDFSLYRTSSLRRRITDLLRVHQLQYISELIPLLIYKKGFFEEFVAHISVSVTGFFRDPWVYKILAEQIAINYTDYLDINVWSAGCATGEEAYSLAILFKELGLLGKTKIVATDMCQQALETGRLGIYSNAYIRQYSANYQHAGGNTSFSDYFTARYDLIKMTDDIMSHISFRLHNLVVDVAWGKVQLIVCRNVLIYFSEELQCKVLHLFSEALVNNGLLLLGPQDCLYASVLECGFEVVDEDSRLYRRKIRG